MRYVLIDGGTDGSEDVTNDLIKRFLPCIRGEEYGVLKCRSEDHLMDVQVLNAADAVVFFAPVYQGGLSSDMLAFLSHLNEQAVRSLPVCVYLHTDLYDPRVCAPALSFFDDWCAHMKWNMKRGTAFGGDRIIAQARNSEVCETFCARIDRIMNENVDVFAKGKQPDLYVKPPLVRVVYDRLAERWIKKNLNENK